MKISKTLRWKCAARLVIAATLFTAHAAAQSSALRESSVVSLGKPGYGATRASLVDGRVYLQQNWSSFYSDHQPLTIWELDVHGFRQVAEVERDLLTSNLHSIGQSMTVHESTIVEGYPQYPQFFIGGIVRIRTVDADWNVTSDESIVNPLTARSGFGVSVQFDGEALVIGANLTAINQIDRVGCVFVYRREAGTWTLKQFLAPDTIVYSEALQDFGFRTLLRGDDLLVSSRTRLHHYRKDAAGKFVLDQVLESPLPPSANSQFGYVFDLQGNTLAMGDARYRYGDGYVHVYRRTAAGQPWQLHETVRSAEPGYAAPPQSGNGFGGGVALNGDRLIAAAQSAAGVGVNRGVICEYRLGAGGLFGPTEHRVFFVAPVPVGSLQNLGFLMSTEGDLLLAQCNAENSDLGLNIFSLSDSTLVCNGTPGNSLGAVRIKPFEGVPAALGLPPSYGLIFADVPPASRMLLAAAPAHDPALPGVAFGAPGLCLQQPWRAVGSALSSPQSEVVFAMPSTLDLPWHRMSQVLGEVAVQAMILSPGGPREWGPAYLVHLP